MVQVRKKAAVNYAEGGDSDSDADAPGTARKAVGRGTSPKGRSTPKAAAQRKRRAPAAEDEEAGEATGLLAIVKKHGTALAVAAKDWIQQYKDNRTRATAELLTFIIQVCGTEEEITEDELEELEVDQVKASLDERAQEDGLDDHFRAKGAKNFRSNYLELWDKIVREAYHADVLFDNYLLDRVINLLIALNTSVVREFRRVATLTAVQLVTSFIHVTRILTEGRATAERQLAVEEKKKGGKGSSERSAAFKRAVDRSHARISELSSYTDSIFQAICQHRFRDCAEDIRATVIEGIGHWIRAHPSHFLSDQYLKYIAWALSDKDAVVRSCAVSALLGLYSQHDNLSPLHDFTERFQQRFKELIYDVDECVAVKGVQLLTVLVREEEVPVGSVREVYTLLGDDSHGIRHAVAELVAGMLEEQGERALARQGQAGRSTGKKPAARRRSGEAQHTAAELQLAGLLQLLHLLGNEEAAGAGQQDGAAAEPEEAAPLAKELVAQAVDALFDKVPVLQDWALLVGWLKGSKAAEAFGEAGVTNLAHVLRMSMTKATGGQLLAGHPDRKAKSKERQDAQATARQDATLALMKDLPTLLKKLQTDPAQAAAIVGVLPELKLELYSLKRQEKAFAGLVATVKDTLFKHDDEQAALECVRALALCAKEGTDAIKDAAQLGLRQCCDEAVKRLAAAVDSLEAADAVELSTAVAAFEEHGEEEEAEVLYDCRVALARLRALQLLDGGVAGIEAAHDALNRLLEMVSAGQQRLTGPIASAAVSNTMLLLLWQFRGLDPESPDPRALREIARRRSLFVTQLESILDSEADDARAEAVQALSDLCLCCSAERCAGSALEEACFSPSDQLVHHMWEQWGGVIQRELEEGATDKEAAQLAAAKAKAASAAAQLVLFQAIPQRSWLAAQLISHFVGPYVEKEVTDTVKELCRLLKKLEGAELPKIYLEAMKASYARAQELAAGAEEEDDSVLDQFVMLSHRIAAGYAGFNASAPALELIAARGAAWALDGAPDRLPFLQGVACFLSRLPAGLARTALASVETAAAAARDMPASAAEAEYPWNLYFDFVGMLQDRVAKGVGPKSALKKAAGGGTAKKIAFAGEDEEEGEEVGSEDENLEPLEEQGEEEEEEEDQPGPSSRHAQQAARPGRRPAQAPARGRQRGSLPTQQAQQEEMEVVPGGGIVSSGGWRQRRGAAPAAAAARRAVPEQAYQAQHIDSGSEEEEEQAGPVARGSSQDDFFPVPSEVLPTEEQLPGMPRKGRAAGGGGGSQRGGGGQAGTRRRQAKMQPVFQEEEEEEAAEESGEEEEEEEGLSDEDLPQIKGRSRQPAVVDRQPVAQQEEDVDDVASQEVALARAAKKRRR